MRISDWSSDVCSSDLREAGSALITFQLGNVDAVRRKAAHRLVKRGGYILHFKKKGGHRRSIDPPAIGRFRQDRKSVGEGKSVSVSVDLGGRRIHKKKQRNTITMCIHDHPLLANKHET